MRNTTPGARPPTPLPAEPPLSGAFGTIWLAVALAALLNTLAHPTLVRLVDYPFVLATAGLVLVSALALWKGLDPGGAFRQLARNTVIFLRCEQRNVVQRRGVGDRLGYGITGAALVAVLAWFVIAA